MSDEEDRESGAQLAIIREVYDSDSAHENFELELERALERGVPTIVIEPTTLGDETARWIAVGNCLHKTAVLAGFGAITSGLTWRESAYVCVPLGTLSLFCMGVYTASWQFDPCCKYQVCCGCCASKSCCSFPLDQKEYVEYKNKYIQFKFGQYAWTHHLKGYRKEGR